MTISFAYQVGDFEMPSETLRKLVFDKWSLIDSKPTMVSPQGFDGSVSSQSTDNQNSTNDWIAAKKKDYIRFKTTDHIQQKSNDLDNFHIRKNYIVTIDVFSTNSYLSGMFREEVENILFQNIPNTSNRIKKTNGTQNSGIVTFDRQALEWLEIGTFEDEGLVRQWQAEIGCLFQKNKI